MTPGDRAQDGAIRMEDEGGSAVWPVAGHARVVFLLDTRSAVEHQRLCEVVAERAAADASWDIVDLADDDAMIRLAAEAGTEAAADTWLQPLRLIWVAPPRSGGRGLLRDLFATRLDNPGPRRARRLARQHPERQRLLGGQGDTLASVRERYDELWASSAPAPARNVQLLHAFIRRQALIVLDRAERNERGPRYKVARLLPGDVFASAEFRTRLADIAQQRDADLAEVEEEAAGYLEEMGATQTPFTLDLLIGLMRAMYRSSHDEEIDVVDAQFQAIRALARERPLVFVITHKSMLDAMALQCALFERNLPLPLAFGGINLNTPGIGTLARRAGVIFLRRSFQDNEVYKTTFRRYIDYLIEKRFSLMWALEGTRSRTGKLLPPRYGLFNYVVESILRTRLFEVTFVPVNIAFEQITEVADYALEQRGGYARLGGIGWFLRFLKPRQPHGRIFLRFGAPLQIGDVVDAERLEAGLDEGEKQAAVQKIAFESAVRMNAVAPITATAVVTLILLAAGLRAQPLANIQYLARPGMALLRRRRLEVVGRTDFKRPDAVRETLERLETNGIVTSYDEGEERLYGIGPDQHLKAAYYRNTIIHHFVTDALVELALLGVAERDGDSEAAFWSEMDELRDLLKHEFYFPRREDFVADAERVLTQRFRAWRAVLAQGPEAVAEMMLSVRPLLAHAVLRSFVDAYQVVARRLVRLGDAPVGDAREFVSACVRTGHQLRLEQKLFSEESVSRNLYENALKLADQRGLTVSGPEVRAGREALREALRSLTGRLDRVLEFTLRMENAEDN